MKIIAANYKPLKGYCGGMILILAKDIPQAQEVFVQYLENKFLNGKKGTDDVKKGFVQHVNDHWENWRIVHGINAEKGLTPQVLT